MILRGDCIEQMATLDPDSIDAIVCDPPYGIGFMGKEWDGQAIAAAAQRDRETRKSLGPASPSRPGRTESRSASAFGNEAIIAGPVRGGGDFQAWCETWATEALRVLKPGGHLLAFGGTRTYHRLACAVEDAGFEIRDSLIWLYGSGFPKSLDVSKAIDKAAGHWRGQAGEVESENDAMAGPNYERTDKGDPITPEAQRWQGWGTAMKPSHEPVVVARKPLAGTVAANVLEHGTGALNVDGCRVESGADYHDLDVTHGLGGSPTSYSPRSAPRHFEPATGRWPPNVILSHLPGCEQVGVRKVKTGEAVRGNLTTSHFGGDATPLEDLTYAAEDGTETIPAYNCADGCPVAALEQQEEGVARFFYCAKASRSERNAGLGGFEERETAAMQGNLVDGQRLAGNGTPISTPRRQNVHPTVKPIALMRWLVRLVTPPSGTVLDPFAGSGTTGVAAALEGFDFIGIEREPEYADIAEARIKFWAKYPGADVDKVLPSDARAREIEATGQLGLLA